MIKHNGHEVLALPYILESIVETIINWTVKRKKTKQKYEPNLHFGMSRIFRETLKSQYKTHIFLI